MRAVPLAVLSVGAFTAGVIISGKSDERDAVARFGKAWELGDYAAMYAELTPDSAQDVGMDEFEQAYEGARRISTAQDVQVLGEARGPLEQDGDTVVGLPVTVSTMAFGPVEGEIAVPVADGGIEWRPNLVFPGLSEGQKLERTTEVAKRAPILADDRTPLAEGSAEARTTTGAGGIVTGSLAAPKPAQAKELAAAGYPEGSPTGTSGLELAFNST
ncbi:MAG: hypothetical protein H0V25_03370, partial [Solirubrobacterales bacterium]|nr:hypothetical protein [Solirubrobacterales bacterium]